MLQVKLLEPGAKPPICSRPSEDLGYDLFALEQTYLVPGQITKVKTGVAIAETHRGIGFLIKDRSSMASKGATTHGGVIDVGYRGEIVVLMSLVAHPHKCYCIEAGDKIAQLVPIFALSNDVEIVEELSCSSRGELGFGSSGR